MRRLLSHLRALTSPSLARDIFWGVTATIIIALIAVGCLAYYSVDEEIVEIYDSQMINSATVLWSTTRDAITASPMVMDTSHIPLNAADRKALKKYAKWRSYRVWRNSQLIRSDNVALSGEPPRRAGFSDESHAGINWHFYTLYVPADHMIVEVGEKRMAREKLTGHVLNDLLLPLSLAVPLIGLGIWLGIRRGLTSLSHFTTEIASRSPDNLSPLEGHFSTSEIRPLAKAINALFRRVELARERERLFTDNAAHELRTPLATLNLQADVILTSKTVAQRREATEALQKGIRRTARLLDQLLTLARIAHTAEPSEPSPVVDVVRTTVQDFYSVAKVRDIRLSVSRETDHASWVNAPLFRILLNNLVDNAIKYTPDGGTVEIAIEAKRICITDSGPGIPLQEQDKVFQRFYRMNGHTQHGSGLGLSIVRTVADILGLNIQLDTPQNRSGLIVIISLPEIS